MQKIANGIWKMIFGTPEEFTPVSLRKTRIAQEGLACMDEPFLPFQEEAVNFSASARGITITLPMKTDEDIYGFGEQLLSMNYAGRKRHVKVNSDPRVDTGEGHAPVPFYISTAGYGLFVDTFRYATFYMGTNSEKGVSRAKCEVNIPHTEFSESALYALKRSKEERRIIIEIPATEGIEIYLFSGNVKEVFRNRNIRTLSQVRSSGSLAAPLPFMLYSDLYGHREFIRGIVTSSFSGMLWAPEVRDCANGTDLLRRVQTIVFSPHTLLNCWRIPYAPWKQVDIEKNLNGEFMQDQEYYTDACRKLLELRMSLLPYFYSAFMDYHKTGLPPVRAMVMDYPEDPEVRNIDDQYFFGKDLLVCPLTLEDGTAREVYLPDGKWYDFFSTKVYEGGRRFQIEAGEEEIPVFVRDGALVPLAKPVLCVKEDTVFEMTVRSYGSGEAEFVLYEDDFTTYDYEKKESAAIPVRRTADGDIEYPENTWRYRFLKNA